ncbi:hypothetical protein BDF21DRAFT_37067 [Thamnidium elegans]|nr:hypothetical protein BDF21DRAFT_37067 [Thamnidium elegans]
MFPLVVFFTALENHENHILARCCTYHESLSPPSCHSTRTFKDPFFILFKNNLETVMSTEQTTQELLLQWAMSALTEVMENQLEAQSNMIRELLLQSEQPKNSW